MLPKGIRIKKIANICYKEKGNATETFELGNNKYKNSLGLLTMCRKNSYSSSTSNILKTLRINDISNQKFPEISSHKGDDKMNTASEDTTAQHYDNNKHLKVAQGTSRVSRCNSKDKSLEHSTKRTEFEKIKSTTYVCGRCHDKFSTFNALDNHLNQANPCQKPSVSCPICNKTFVNISSGNAHLNTHKEKQPKHACAKCGKEFFTTVALQVHLEHFHTEYFDATPTGFSCKFCSEQRPNKKSILQHVNKNHKHVTSFLCEKCGKSFWNENSFRAHVLIHSDAKAFICQICSKSFKLQSSLRAHIGTHNEERKFVCDECGKTFKKNFSLTEHKKFHAGYFPFFCNICNKLFVSRSSCNVHHKIHTL